MLRRASPATLILDHEIPVTVIANEAVEVEPNAIRELQTFLPRTGPDLRTGPSCHIA